MKPVILMASILGAIAIALLLIPARAMQPWDNQITNTGNAITTINPVTRCNYNIVQIAGSITRNIQAVNCLTGLVDFQSTNASSVFNSVMTQINLNKGGVVHVTGYNTTHPYNLTRAIILPDKGHLYFYGDGAEFTVLKIPIGSDNNMFQYSGVKTDNSYFNVFTEFEGIGNRSINGTNNSGFVLNGTSFGLIDSLWENIFLRDFMKYDIYMNNNCWNNKINDDTIELAQDTGVYITGGLTCQDWKINNSKFLYNKIQGIYTDAYMGTIDLNWFYNQTQYGIKNNGGVGNVITNNRFFDNGAGTNNLYYDLWNLGNDNVINDNNFEGSDRSNKPKYAIFEDTFEHRNVITGNHLSTSTRTYATGTIGFAGQQQDTNLVSGNTGFNSVGKVSSPFYTGTQGIGTTLIPNGGNSTLPRNGIDATNTNTPCLVSVTGGTGIAIVLKDNLGNTISNGLTGLTEQEVPFGYKINITWVVAPTVTVYFQ